MIVTAHQPAYLPWLGYFEKIARSDLFIYLDTVQFEKNSFINRNKIKGSGGPLWLTIPVKSKGHFDKPLNEIEIDNSKDWKSKHLDSIRANYKRAPRFTECYPLLEALYGASYNLLSELCFAHLTFWLGELGITTKVVKSSEASVSGKKSDYILELCRHFGAASYISGALGRNYLESDKFEKQGIEVVFQSYEHPSYPQQWGTFEPYMSVVDLWMNTSDYDIIWRKS